MGYKILGFGILSLVLMYVDEQSHELDEVRAVISLGISPIISVADYPSRATEFIEETFSSRTELREQIDVMERELLILRAKTEKMAALSSENKRLRSLLGSAEKLEDNVLVAELVGVDPNPRRHEVIIDKGTNYNVFVGQPVLDAEGLMGQVIEVSPLTSRVLLVSDQSHSVPVQVVRSNLRLIAQGSGISKQLNLMHVQDTADIREGDLLVSSGLGERFPVGYPVGTVIKMQHDPAQPFATVVARPTALLDRSRHVLLVFSDNRHAPDSEAKDG